MTIFFVWLFSVPVIMPALHGEAARAYLMAPFLASVAFAAFAGGLALLARLLARITGPRR